MGPEGFEKNLPPVEVTDLGSEQIDDDKVQNVLAELKKRYVSPQM